MKIATEALVIWEHKTGEADRVITLLTPEGVVSAYARGSLKPGGKLTSATAMLGYSSFELAEGKNMYTVAEAESILKFPRISADMRAYALACYFCELERLLAPADAGSAEFLSLALNALHLISESDRPLALVKCVFELRAMSAAGYMPDVETCSECGESEPGGGRFDADSGNLLCADCAQKRGLALNITSGALLALRYIITAPVSRAFSFELKEPSLSALARIAEDCVRRWIEHPLPTLDFYKTLAD